MNTEFFQNLFPYGKGSLHAFASSDKGKFRQENQDNFLILKPENNQTCACSLMEEQFQRVDVNWSKRYVRVVVADGMGGHEGGQEISRAAVTELMQVPPQTSPAGMRSVILKLHKTLQAQFSSKGGKSPGTTLIMADVKRRSGKGVMLSVGDSRALLLRKNKWCQLTCDHNLSEFAWRDGELTREEYDVHIQSGDQRLMQAFGYGSIGIIPDKAGYKPYRFDRGIRLDLKKELPPERSRHADVFTFQLCPGDILMLASDGLWRAFPGDSWHDGVVSGELLSQKGVDKLVQNAVEQPKANDNVTVVVCGFSPVNKK